MQHDQLAVECVQYRGNQADSKASVMYLAHYEDRAGNDAHIDERSDKTCFSSLGQDLRVPENYKFSLSAECSIKQAVVLTQGSRPQSSQGIFRLRRSTSSCACFQKTSSRGLT